MGRVLFIGDDVATLHVADKQLHATSRNASTPGRSAPCEDLDLIVLDTLHGLTLDVHVLRALANAKTAVIVTDERHLPAGLMLPYIGNQSHGAVLEQQVAMSLPRKKQAWAQIVKGKVLNQAAVLSPSNSTAYRLEQLARTIRSGDTTNVEAQAARLYWSAILPYGQRRDRHASDLPNAALNYGYAIARALVARATVRTGLHPALALHHSARTNPFALVDDLIEPLRPIIDHHVLAVTRDIDSDLTPELKRAVVQVLTTTATYGNRQGPLTEITERYLNGFRRYVASESATVDTPTVVHA